MAVPDFQSMMLPLMRIASDKQTHLFREAVDAMAQELGLSEADRSEMLPSGGSPLFYNRLAWSKTHLKMAGLLELPHFASRRAGWSLYLKRRCALTWRCCGSIRST